MARLEDDERAALRESLGFSDLSPGDTFSELARRSQLHESSLGDAPATTEPASGSVASVAQIEREVARLTAAVAALTAQVTSTPATLHAPAELDEVVRMQDAIVARLTEVEREICAVTRAGFEQLSARLDALETGGGRRGRLDVLRRQAGQD